MSNPSLRYQVYYTTEDKTPINIPRSSVVSTAGDIVFIGKNRIEYGEVFNENLLHLLEHFAAEENPNKPGTPNLDQVMAPLLSKPTLGQIWYNKTTELPHAWNGKSWISFESNDSVAGNSGVILHGQQIPRPVNPTDGYVYNYNECSWVVSPFGFTEPERVIYLSCFTDSQAIVTMQYRNAGIPALRTGYASYAILGIRDTKNHGVPFPTPNVPGLTPTPTVTPTITPTRTPMASPTITPTRTRTPGQTRSATPTPTVTRTETPAPSITRTNTPTPTPTPTITATVTPSRPLPIYVDIYDQTITRSTEIGYSVLNTGFIIVNDADSMNVPSQWLFNDDPANYSVRATLLSGVAPTGIMDAWLNCANNRVWELAAGTSTFRIEIMRNVDNFIMDTCIVAMTVTI
jgi:hypothetical protein